MALRNRKLEQAEPRAGTPVKKFARKHPVPTGGKPKGKFDTADLPTGTITQHRARPGRTSQS
jgi:hypothetical protein